jgi:hypothetical protein
MIRREGMLHSWEISAIITERGKLKRERSEILNAASFKLSLRSNRKSRDHLVQALLTVGFEGTKSHTGNMFRRQLWVWGARAQE